MIADLLRSFRYICHLLSITFGKSSPRGNSFKFLKISACSSSKTIRRTTQQTKMITQTSTRWLLMKWQSQYCQGTNQVEEIKVQSRQRCESKCKPVPLDTLQFCIILDTEFSNMTVKNNKKIIKRPISSLKIENKCTDFQNTVRPEAVPVLSPLGFLLQYLWVGLPWAQLQRNGTWRGRSPPSFTSGLWNSRPAREWMLAQQYSQ